VPDLHRLLDVQDRDVTLDQLRHRRAHLPARAELAAVRATLARLDTEVGALQTQLHDIDLAQKKLEDEIAGIDAKSDAESKKLNSGSITAPREIQALSDEIDALARRKRALEDDELGYMEQAEPLTADLERLTAERATAAADADRLAQSLATDEAAIDAEIASVTAERAQAVGDLPGDLVERYERLRAKLGGVAVARLEGDRCLGCHISLPAMEVDAIRHAAADAIVTHEECGRILVR
jgi:hypothetical protein